jgi:hypothetical protein
VDGAEVGIRKERHKESFGCFLQRLYRFALEAQRVGIYGALKIVCDFSNLFRDI